MYKSIITRIGEGDDERHNKKLNEFIELENIKTFKIIKTTKSVKYLMLITIIKYNE